MALSSLPGATKADKPRFGMAREATMTLLVNPTLAEVAIYTVIATLTFSAVSLVLALVLTLCHGSCLVASDLI